MTVLLWDLERFQELGLGLAAKASPSRVGGRAAGLGSQSSGVGLKMPDSGSQVEVNSESDRIASHWTTLTLCPTDLKPMLGLGLAGVGPQRWIT